MSPVTPDLPRLELSEVGLRFGPVRALEGVSLRVGAGEILALLGDSGCGKSTLLRVVAGLERPGAGEIRLDGRMVGNARTSVPPEARGVGLMFQDYALFPHLTVGENVRFGLHGRPDAQARAVVRERLEQVGLWDRADSYPGTLSGGESQRVALARALAPEPRILLLDEPFSNLDRRTRDHVRADTLAVLRATRTTTLLVTHDPEEALGLADRIALMRAGRLVQVGTGRDLYHRPVSRFAARFFGALVEFDGRCRDGGVETPFGRLAAPHLAEGAAAHVCLRPEAIRLRARGEGMAGMVLERRFLGATDLLVVGVDALDLRLNLPVAGADPARPGDRIGLALAQEGQFIFSADRD